MYSARRRTAEDKVVCVCERGGDDFDFDFDVEASDVKGCKGDESEDVGEWLNDKLVVELVGEATEYRNEGVTGVPLAMLLYAGEVGEDDVFRFDGLCGGEDMLDSNG